MQTGYTGHNNWPVRQATERRGTKEFQTQKQTKKCMKVAQRGSLLASCVTVPNKATRERMLMAQWGKQSRISLFEYLVSVAEDVIDTADSLAEQT